MSYEINVAHPDELPAAHLLLTGQASISSLAGDDPALGVPTFLVARTNGELCSAAAIENRSPGLISIVLPLATSTNPVLRELLLRAAFRTASQMPKQATVLLLERDDPIGEDVMSGLGFTRAANIAFLAYEVRQPRSSVPANIQVTEFSQCSDAEITGTIAATLVGSLDCCALLEVVGAEEMVAGFADRAAERQRYWRVVKQDGCVVGCLLVHRVAEADELELMYMGVVPEARGRGLGRALVTETLVHATRTGISRVVLAVDEANAPALRIYRESGFGELARRVMWCALEDKARCA